METYTVKDLTFRYPESKKDVLKNISFSVESGEFVTICGLSGCGKSTLLRQLKTALQPYGERTGTILFEGQELDKADFRTQSEKIGFVMQSPDNQSITDKVWHELAFGLESLGLKNSVIQRRTAETASFFGIEKWFEKNVDELSGGQKQILNLASVMIMQPSVLILDEPTAQLDPIASENFISMLRKINLELGTTIILSEHSLEEVFGISDRIIVMSDGKIISDNQPLYTGKKLFELKSSVFCSLPAPVRVYEYADGKEGKSPLSVSEGRKWLESFTEDKILREIPKREYKEPSDKPVLEVQNLWFRYERNLSDILKGLSLKIYAGEILTILGGNGAGKTTMLSVISGILTQNRGKILINGKEKDKNKSPSSMGISVLPQNPQTLFVKAKVEDDLYEIFSGTKVPYEEQCQKVENVIRLCGLENLREQHPYDLSGGEQQRAALAKILLTEPKILLLDEPTKGLDTAFKSRFASIIKRLAQNGTAVAAVSHDIEFCAEYSDKCAMMFNGHIVSTGSPQEFFTDNEIYTTSVSRMSRGKAERAVTVSDLLYALDKENKDSDFHGYGADIEIPSNNRVKPPEIPRKKKQRSIFYKIISLTALAVSVGAMCVTADIFKIPFLAENKILCHIIMFLSSILFMLMTGNGNGKINIVKKERNMKRMLLSLATVFIAVPITIFAGIYFFDDTKYLFISLLIMFESMFPFYIMFEKQGIQARELVLTATICAMCVSGRAVLYMIPEFKPVTALVIISAAALGSESGFLIGSVTMLVSNIFFGQGVWTPWQMFTMGLIGFVAGFVYQRGIFPQNKISLAVFGFISAFVIYGGIMNPATLVLSGTGMNTQTLLSSYIVGLPVDTVHAVSTAMFLYIGAEPIISKLERIKRKYGLIKAEN